MIYGTATFKDEEYFQSFNSKSKSGIITAYLPEDKIFAIFFGEGQWITFHDWTEEQFLEKFEVKLK